MRAVLICPSERPHVRFLAETQPLALAPVLGQSLVEYWLSCLACTGFQEVLLLASDRHEQLQEAIGTGARWGLAVAVREQPQELTPLEARSRYCEQPEGAAGQEWLPVMDHLPGFAQFPLFTSYQGWFSALNVWMPEAITPDRVGVREIQPSVWAGTRSRISSSAELRPPCWLGQSVSIGPRTRVGPGAILEDGALIEEDVQITDSFVGPRTFVGRYSQIKDSIAWGDTLINWKTDSIAKVPDAFLLCALRSPARRRGGGLFRHLAGLCSQH